MEKNARVFRIVRVVVIVVAIVLLVLLTWRYYAYTLQVKSASATTGNVAKVDSIPVTYSNLEAALSSHPLVKDLPEDAGILLRFYNFRTGERQWEKSFVLSSEGVKEISNLVMEDYNLVLYLDSRYLNGLTTTNFCSMIQTANKNGDLGLESSISDIALAWKFRSVLKYKSCFGM